jgi:hypothetical protein
LSLSASLCAISAITSTSSTLRRQARTNKNRVSFPVLKQRTTLL